ncbi:transcriptional regulator [Prodigiosinella confusarubida]|uniref:Transcriptional regulator n=1 Tax=Serratia sp. (strain ATCC 39006) TaxID=104623 RepID=A0A2I5TFM4_SERS3|nr:MULTISPECIES: substrate-binding domain-containing protein [Enterobacterales]AUG99059.1 transcriptional regulator [Serratia sp. ATCC 39006]AUH03374.1 transcriptional regulator [Serratia sp. ATCC 39006]
MKNHRVTLQDIANLANVTKMTVSRYLRTPNQVAPETGKKIAQIMEEVNYIPNRAPEMLLNTKSYTIGVLIPSFKNQIFADMLAGIESVTSGKQYQILIANYNYKQKSEEEQIINLLAYNIDGIILSEKSHTVRAVKYLRSAKIPIVEVMDIEGPCLDMEVGYSNSKAAFDMVSTMLENRNKKKIIYLGSQDDLRDELRFQGYCEAMRKKGLPTHHINPKSISSIQLGTQLLALALKEHPDLDGIFCTNDDIAVGALISCFKKGINVPDDISIAGFHGLEIGKEMVPSLASVITPRFMVGQKAASILLNKINDTHYSTHSMDLGYQIYLGETL